MRLIDFVYHKIKARWNILRISANANAEELDFLVELLDTIENEDDWISVKDRPPEKNGEYLISTKECITAACYERGRRISEWTDYFEGYIDFEPTHWMPLPAPPKKRKGE